MSLPSVDDPQLVDPELAAFFAQDPTVLQPPKPAQIAVRPHDRVAWELAAAVLVMGTLVRRHLAAQTPPPVGKTVEHGHDAWRELAPTWLRLALPAVKQAYALGKVEGLSDDELTALATDYTAAVGDYVNTTSADALNDAMNMQLAQRWSPELAWHRASAAYGLDRRDMRAYLRLSLNDKSADPIPMAARALVDRAFLRRAQTIGEEESYSATQSGQAMAWLWLERQGRIPLGSTREWEMGANEEHCATCLELHQQRVPLSEPFVFVSGAKIWAPRAHPGCYCRVRLVPPEISKADWNTVLHPRDAAGRWAGEHKTDLVLAAGFSGAVLGVKYKPVAAAARSAHAMADPARAAGVARTLAQHPGQAEHFILFDDSDASGRAVRDLHAKAVAANPDIARINSPSNDFTESFFRANRIRSAPPAANLLQPGRARDTFNARALGRAIDAADPKLTPDLYRSMHLLGDHKVGDIIDFGDFASFTSEHRIAHEMGKLYQQVLQDERASLEAAGGHVAPEGATQRIYRIPGGQVKALSLSAAGKTPTHTAMEWLAGGKHRVVAVEPAAGHMPALYHLEPHGEVAKAMPKAAGIALVAGDTGRVLMLQRALDPKDRNGGKWELPGGTLEPGEAPLDAAWREWEEECRRRRPKATPLGFWTHGVYAGFAFEIPNEAEIPPHRRGRVANPDDPDGDQVEAIAWWDPAHLPGNRAVRKELLESLPALRAALRGEISKAFDERERRDAGGRWTRVDQATQERPAPTTEAPPADPLKGSPLKGSPLQASPFLERNPLRNPRPTQNPDLLRSPFARGPSPLQLKRPRNLSHRLVIMAPARRQPQSPPGTFYLPADHFHDLSTSAPLGALYDTGEMVNFSDAASRPVASSTMTPWQMLSYSQLLTQHAGIHASEQTVDELWHGAHGNLGIEETAYKAWTTAMENVDNPVDPLVEHLDPKDLKGIFKLAGWAGGPGGDDPVSMRKLIVSAVRKQQLGGAETEAQLRDDSLAHAYGDWMTFHDPIRLLGRTIGRPIDEALDAAENANVMVRDHSNGVPVQQVFAFEQGVHPQTSVAGGEAYLEGQYVPLYHRYRSAIADSQAHEPLRFGLRETVMLPFEDNGGGLWTPPNSG